jgi:hypothetical protein
MNLHENIKIYLLYYYFRYSLSNNPATNFFYDNLKRKTKSLKFNIVHKRSKTEAVGSASWAVYLR